MGTVSKIHHCVDETFLPEKYFKYIDKQRLMEIIIDLINNNKSVNYGFGGSKYGTIITNMMAIPRGFSTVEFSDIIIAYINTLEMSHKIHPIIERKLKKHQKSGSYKKYDMANGSIHEYNYFLPMFDKIYEKYFKEMKSYEQNLLSDFYPENIKIVKSIMKRNQCNKNIAIEIFLTSEMLKLNNKTSPKYNDIINFIFQEIRDSLNYDEQSSYERDSIDMYIPEIRNNILESFRKYIQDRKNKIKT